MKEPRTDFDFSKHEHRIEKFTSQEGNEIRVDHLQIGKSRSLYLKFINASGTLTVSGDFGNYVFCRPFIPSKGGSVSEMYWYEKLNTHSLQSFENEDYDFDSIIEELEAELEGVEENYSEENQEGVKDYIKILIAAAGDNDKLEYEYAAFRSSMPNCLDYEFAPIYKKTNHRLQIVFDAFEEICKRITE